MKRLLALSLLAALAACAPKHEAAKESAAQSAAAPATPAEEPVAVPAGAYTIDPAHTSILFRVDHLGFSNYTARFKKATAQLQFDPNNLATSTVTVTVDVKSLETDYPDPAQLDFNAELLGEGWLNAVKYPEITFRSVSVEPTGARTMRINGELTLRGVTKPMVLEARFNGGYAGHPMDKNARIGFSATGVLKRSEFGITYGIPAPGTKMGVSDEVNVIIETEFSGPAWTAPTEASGAN
ncbi:YceI family protein [Steroidobacter sp.]|uniref:YceI family protein n=1 Tax=Steroidobacter sp. TaxID=1978227 RepID=UPI001A4E2A47|nr:YceI family protein [Steroidobacter sp.]MBL8265555.1 polyisoprenoid-binding protein [Steroidobacter sp.]